MPGGLAALDRRQGQRVMVKDANSAPIKIDAKAIPAADMQVLCSTILDAVLRHFKSSENQRQFENWRNTMRQGGPR